MPQYEAYPFLNKGPRSARHAPGLTARPTNRQSTASINRNTYIVASQSPQPREAILKSQREWETWPVMTFEVRNLPRDITTFQLYTTFEKHGSISRIEIYEDPQGNKKGNARLVFAPPPREDFWSSGNGLYTIELPEHAGYRQVTVIPGKPIRTFQVTSPIRKYIKYPETMKLYPQTLDFGFMFDPTSMMDMYRVGVLNERDKFTFQVDLRLKRLNVYFQCKFEEAKEPDMLWEVYFSQLTIY